MDWLSMGGYAIYIWPSYGIAAAILISLLLISWRNTRVQEAEVERLRSLGLDPRRSAPAGAEIGEKAREVAE